MDELFELPVFYKVKELLFPTRLHQLGYTHRFVVDVYGQEVFFEPDEERNYRALVDSEQLEGNKKIDVELLKTIAERIEAVLK
jgi:hypothetical protein